MKKYKYNFPLLVKILLLVGGLVAIACGTLNVIRYLKNASQNVQLSAMDWASLSFAIILPIAYFVLAVPAYFNSYYTVTEKEIILRWGLVKNIVSLDEVTEIKFIVNKKRLELTFKDETYFLIAINSEWFEDFIDEIKQKRPQIPYTQETEVTK